MASLRCADMKFGSHVNFPEAAPYGFTSDLTLDLHFVRAVCEAIGGVHVVTASLVTEREIDRQCRHSVSLVQFYRLDGLGVGQPSNSHVATVRVGGSTSK